MFATSLTESQMNHANAWALVTKQEEIKRDEVIHAGKEQLTTWRKWNILNDKPQQQFTQVWELFVLKIFSKITQFSAASLVQ